MSIWVFLKRSKRHIFEYFESGSNEKDYQIKISNPNQINSRIFFLLCITLFIQFLKAKWIGFCVSLGMLE